MQDVRLQVIASKKSPTEPSCNPEGIRQNFLFAEKVVVVGEDRRAGQGEIISDEFPQHGFVLRNVNESLLSKLFDVVKGSDMDLHCRLSYLLGFSHRWIIAQL
ncbi:hypothetical protein CIHG_07343 [Coccidioides immitis H538.4]|uniref:Uncharacterized protein n=3 Tax=Coccidioides immitis TaxID=5501 RepID=A0A0J8QX55_COCIT|nr:hypothetical protein CIRG_00673 [Coccidioides immitis RMSCC 2394]KMU75948.1 hypothetical protein CISG_05433 [Coccidioides immitis RMSCC 3703]KMU89536.1 hypothetical protein CIHG_07343 [Coccidioides immitis H538.4]